MKIPPSRLPLESHIDTHPFLMERLENYGNDHVIDITGSADVATSSTHGRPFNGANTSEQEDRPSTSAIPSTSQPSISASNGSNFRNSSFLRRVESRRQSSSPLNSVLWILIKLVLTISQIIAAITVLSLSRHEQPQTPLFAWIVGRASGRASGRAAIIPFICWRYRHRSQVLEQDRLQSRQNYQINVPAGRLSLSVRTVEGENRQTTSPSPRISNGLGRLCIVFLAISYIRYAMSCILCTTICCLACIISALSTIEDLSETQGATPEAIDALPTYKFKLERNKNDDGDRNSNSDANEGGVIAGGTEKERMLSGEDAICSVCLETYANNDELRELLCSHFFHKECVDTWLKINASCPLCKNEVGESSSESLSAANASQQ